MKADKGRITLDDTFITAISKVSEGNPGAVTVCGQLLRDGASIDPDAAFGGLAKLLALDALGIYGPHVWILYKDRCGQNLARLIAVLRAHQLGFVSRDELVDASTGGPMRTGLDVDGLYARVQERLPDFDPQGVGRRVHGQDVAGRVSVTTRDKVQD